MKTLFGSARHGRPFCTIALTLLLTGLGGCAARLNYMDGWYHLESGEYALGIQDLQRATEQDPENVRFRVDWLAKRDAVTEKLLVRADAAIMAQHLDEAREIYQTILAYYPDNVRALAGLDRLDVERKLVEQTAEATVALKQGHRDQAEALVARVLAVNPKQSDAKALKAALDEQAARSLLDAPTLSNLYQKPITLEFRDASLKMMFDVLSKSTGINFVLDRDVKSDQHTTLSLKRASLEDAVDMIAATNQLEKKVLNGSSVLIYPNTPAKVKEYQDLVVRAFHLNNADAKSTSELIKTLLKLKDIFVDDKLNMLIVRDTPEAVALTEKLVAMYDVAVPEVMLDVEVLEVDRTRALNLGIQITDQLTATPLNTINTYNPLGTNPTGNNTSSQSLYSLLHLNTSLIGVTTPSVTVNASQQDSDVSLLANPRIRVRNHEKAKVLIGDKIPTLSTTTTSTGFVSENFQYQDVGMKLNVEPTIYPNDEVAIKLDLEVSSVGQEVKSASGAIAYQIGTRSADTVLRLKDGETQVLAGLINSQESNSANGLPGLTSLPIIGRLFAGNTDNHNKTEIVLSITPHLVRNIRRQDPALDMFWSGTDAVLRSKLLQLRVIDDVPASSAVTPANNAAAPTTAVAPSSAANPNTAPSVAVPGSNPSIAPTNPAAVAPSQLKLGWVGPSKLKVGEEGQLDLTLQSGVSLRGLPLQLGYDPKLIEVLSVTDQGYFDKDGGHGNLSQTIDKSSGRIAIALGSNKDVAATSGTLLRLKFKALVAGPTGVELSSLTPVASGQSVSRPSLPIRHDMVLE